MSKRFIQAVSVLGVSAILLLMVAGLAARSDIANAQEQDEPTARRTITVSGTGRVTAQPDEATISIGAQITAPTLAEATEQANAIMTKVLAALKAQGIDPKEIQTSTYNVNPVTTYNEGEPPKVTGYQVMNVVNVKVKDIANVGKVLDAGMSAGANYLGGVTFGIADSSKYETEARTAAVKDATHIAETLAAASGVKLGNVISITEGVTSAPPPLPYARSAADAASAGPVETGSLEISTNVLMRFEISE